MENWKLQLTLWYLDQNNCLAPYVFEPDHLFTIFSVPPRTNKGWSVVCNKLPQRQFTMRHLVKSCEVPLTSACIG